MQRLDERYMIDYTTCLGVGAYSKVYLGKSVYPDRVVENSDGLVAIKHINRQFMSEKVVEKVGQEIEVFGMLINNPHPNIVRCYDVIIKKHNVYLIMEHCESGDLTQAMKRPLKEKYVQYYFCQIISGLKFLADLGVYHRDIKPKNILLTANKRVIKIADFGFAQYQSDAGSETVLYGSPLYMAPEIINRMKNASAYGKSDIWSLGILMYEMLFHTHPYTDCQTLPTLIDAINDRLLVVPPDDSGRSLSRSGLELLKRMLNKDPLQRISWNQLYDHYWVNKYSIQLVDGRYMVKYYEDTAETDRPTVKETISEEMMIHPTDSIHLVEKEMMRSDEPIETPRDKDVSINKNMTKTVSRPIPIGKKIKPKPRSSSWFGWS